MRDYGRIAPTFWTGDTGRAIKKAGPEAVIMALYLVTSPLSNMLGLYYQPMLYAAHETGLGIEGASKGLQGCIEAGFCDYDQASEYVWVREMAAWQIGRKLKVNDKLTIGIQREYARMADNPFMGDFFDRYVSDYHLNERRKPKSDGSPLEAPSKQLTGTGKEQEQEQARSRQGKDLRSASADLGTIGGSEPVETGTNGHAKRLRHAIDFEGIVALYHATLTPPLPTVEKLTDKRRGQIRQRWEQDLPDIEAWRNFFEDVKQSSFLMGRVPGREGRPPFRADLEWLTNATNFTAIAEGKYHR